MGDLLYNGVIEADPMNLGIDGLEFDNQDPLDLGIDLGDGIPAADYFPPSRGIFGISLKERKRDVLVITDFRCSF